MNEISDRDDLMKNEEWKKIYGMNDDDDEEDEIKMMGPKEVESKTDPLWLVR